jgi:5,5'-dehydrodivanillate O-demethylase oxygenase subunit
MLSAEKNERLTRIGSRTPMGELLRRYWWPVATNDIATRVPVRRRLLGGDLVLYRDGSGTVGLLAEQCPHRRAALWQARSDEIGAALGRPGRPVRRNRAPALQQGGTAPTQSQQCHPAATRWRPGRRA